MRVRPATDSDLSAISRIHREAFGPTEGPEVDDLVTELLRDETAEPRLSIVAESGGTVIGHVLFTAARLDTGPSGPTASILAPLGVAEAFQRRGVELVFVLGHPSYYPRFGFHPAGVAGFDAPYPILEKNADAWMVKALEPGAVDRFSGTVVCASALAHPEHWTE